MTGGLGDSQGLDVKPLDAAPDGVASGSCTTRVR